MSDNTKELRGFRKFAHENRLSLDRSSADRTQFMWSDTQLAWEAWQARAALVKAAAGVRESDVRMITDREIHQALQQRPMSFMTPIFEGYREAIRVFCKINNINLVESQEQTKETKE